MTPYNFYMVYVKFTYKSMSFTVWHCVITALELACDMHKSIVSTN